MSDKGYIIMLAPFQNMSMRWIFFQIFKWLWSNLKNMQVLFKTKKKSVQTVDRIWKKEKKFAQNEENDENNISKENFSRPKVTSK